MKDDSGGWEGGRSPRRLQEQSTGTREPRDPQRVSRMPPSRRAFVEQAAGATFSVKPDASRSPTSDTPRYAACLPSRPQLLFQFAYVRAGLLERRFWCSYSPAKPVSLLP